jgi:hypothetical protein
MENAGQLETDTYLELAQLAITTPFTQHYLTESTIRPAGWPTS